jgi:MoxR-like ATPase
METSIMNKKIKSIINHLQNQFYERDHIIKAAWAAILSNQHMLQIGMPGTAKSQVTSAICSSIKEAKYFEWLLTRFSAPEEIFGPVSLKGLENDQYRRIITGKLPEAHIAFIDEIFKGNAAILNSMLTAINERRFDNDKERIKIPLITVFGASNELPEEEELDALYDRFILRFDVPYIQDGDSWESLIISATTINNNKATPTISLDELYEIQKQIKNITFADNVVSIMRDIKMNLINEGIIASDRRWYNTVNVLQAWSWLNSHTKIETEDLELLCDMLWKIPSERKILVSTIMSVTNPLNLEAVKFYDDCLDVFNKFNPKDSASISESSHKLHTALNKIDDILKYADDSKTKKMKEIRKTISDWYKQVVAAMDI